MQNLSTNIFGSSLSILYTIARSNEMLDPTKMSNLTFEKRGCDLVFRGVWSDPDPRGFMLVINTEHRTYELWGPMRTCTTSLPEAMWTADIEDVLPMYLAAQ